MQKRYFLKPVLAVLIFAGSFIAIWASSNKTASKKECAESMEECCKKDNKKTSSGEMIWETLSNQFFTTSDISN